MTLPKILFLNGPPGAGKDELANYLREKFPDRVCLYKMTSPIDDALKAFFGMDDAEYHIWREQKKDKSFHTFGLGEGYTLYGALTFRKVLIDFSEKWAKRLFGPGIFGRLAAPRIKKLLSTDPNIIVITDIGFTKEVISLWNHLDVDVDYYLVSIFREGKDFSKDSRDYLNPTELPLKRCYSLENNGSKIEWYAKGKALIRALDSEVDFVA